MRTLEIHGGMGDSMLMVGETLGNLGKHIPAERTVIITDTTVRGLYGREFPPAPVIEIGTGEKIKTLDTVSHIYERLVELEADRSWLVAGIGGGIVCDIAGFAASTYMRGVRFGFVSTTLLAQVDASVGGKNGVNFHGYKNMVGVFNQPEFVICDMGLLGTLPEKEILCGMGEIVKHALIGDAGMLSYLEENRQKALELDPEVIEKLVWDSVAIKSDIVNRDEKEAGERRKLNFGHTFGHAIEKTTDAYLHGEAIAAGMIPAMALSVKKGFLRAEDAERAENLIRELNLPTRIQIDMEQLFDALKKDKKREGDNIHFVFLNGIGNAVVEEITFKDLDSVVGELGGGRSL